MTISSAHAQGVPEAPQPVRRYLFVVETSRAMQRRAQGVQDTLKALLDSNLSGQMRPGDAVAVWTFNETISTNFFSSAAWSPAARASLGTRLPDFLEASTYEKRALLDKVVARLGAQVSTDILLTVILVTTGDDEVQGTPFDNQLRRAFSQWRSDQQKARMPLLTLLRGSQGHFTQWSVGAAPWPLEIPPLEGPVQSSKSKPTDAPKPNQPVTTGPTTRTNTVLNAPAPSSVSLTTTTAVSTARANDGVSPTNSQPTLPALATETNLPPVTDTNSATVATEAAKTNMVAGSPVNRASGPSDLPESTPEIAFSAEVPRREDAPGTRSVPLSHVDDATPTPAPAPAIQSTNASSPAAAAPDPISTATPNLIPPVAELSKPTQIAMIDPMPPNFLHENIKWIVGACVSGIIAIFSILLWLETYSRNQLKLATLPKNKKPER